MNRFRKKTHQQASEVHLYEKGWTAGYSEYRYGLKNPIRLAGPQPRIFEKDAREHIVSRAMDVLRDWRDNRWEGEASARHGLRQALVERGNGWALSDEEAADIVRRAFNRLGRGAEKRPTYEQGQKEHVIAREDCKRCGGPLTAEQQVHGDNFCGSDCARIYLARYDTKWENRQNALVMAANRVMEIAARPLRKCENPPCGRMFRPRGRAADSQCCSPKCAGEFKRILPELICAYEPCSKPFRVSSTARLGKEKYCCFEHWAADNREKEKVLQGECKLCGKPIERANPSMFCSPVCNSRHYQYRSGKVVPKRVTAIVFDFFVTNPVNEAIHRPAPITAEVFDDVFRRAA